jgi:hypothetical protein
MPNPNYPLKMRRKRARDYLEEVHSIELTEKTLTNRASQGLPPKPVYLGTVPYYTQERLDQFAETAFTDESPVSVTRRRIKQHLQSRQPATTNSRTPDLSTDRSSRLRPRKEGCCHGDP